MSFRVLIPQPIAREGIDELIDAGLEVLEPPSQEAATTKKYLGECEGILLRTVPLTKEVLKNAARLEVVSRHGVGLDNIDLEYCNIHGIQVTNAPEANTTSVAEHTIAMLLSITKNLSSCDAQLRRGNFDARHDSYGIELHGKTLGVVGLGSIGRLVAQKATWGLGMSVLGYDPYISEDVAGTVELVDLYTLLRSSDIVTIHLPLTENTANFFSEKQFSAMKGGAYFLNCARGGIVNELALSRSLRSGHLGAAALDVFETEPPPRINPLWELDNVLATPHMAAHTRESLVKMAVHAAQGIVAVAKGEQPRWRVNTARNVESV